MIVLIRDKPNLGFYHSTLNFVGQNVGAKRFDRVKKGLLINVGVSMLLGLIFGLSWQFLLICLGILGVILFVTRYIALASITCAAALPVFWFITTGDVFETVLFAGIAVIIISKHIQNIKRIANGTEIPLGSKKKTAAETDDAKE